MTRSSPSGTVIDLTTAAELAAQLQVDSIRYTTSAGSGHPTSSMAGVDAAGIESAARDLLGKG
jgi:transketolase